MNSEQKCPKCGCATILIDVVQVARVEFCQEPGREGYDVLDVGGDAEWENASCARCWECEWEGTVGDLCPNSAPAADDTSVGIGAAMKHLRAAADILRKLDDKIILPAWNPSDLEYNSEAQEGIREAARGCCFVTLGNGRIDSSLRALGHLAQYIADIMER